MSDCCATHVKKPSDPNKKIDINAVYTCPMHPEVQKLGPGDCPSCGMSLEPLIASLEDTSADAELKDFKIRFLVSSIISVPLVVYAMTDMMMGRHHSKVNLLLQLLGTSVVIFVCGYPILKRAWSSIRNRQFNMFTLIGIGTLSSYLFSSFSTIMMILAADTSFHGHVYFESAATIITLVLLGQILELKARGQTGAALKSLLRLSPKFAKRISPRSLENAEDWTNTTLPDEDIPVDQIMLNDHLRVRPGESIPVDGIIVQGNSYIDESMLTGESIPASKKISDKVYAGTINQSGTFVIQAQGVGQQTVLSQIVNLVASAQRSRAPIQNLADKVAGWFVPGVILCALLTAILWITFGSEQRLSMALLNAVAVLIIACPCALGLATPMSIMVATGKAAKMGILFKNAEAIESMEKIDTIVFDKTGTLTEGKPTLQMIKTISTTEDEALSLAAGLEKHSEHPLALAILNECTKKHIKIDSLEQIKIVAGKGIQGTKDCDLYILGNEAMLKSQGIALDAAQVQIAQWRSQSFTLIFLAKNKELIAIFGAADSLKPSAVKIISQLNKENKTIVLLTGDHHDTAQTIAKKLGIEKVYSEVMPFQKHKVIKELMEQGHTVAMVGDGINDAPALAQAHVGIAMGTGTDIAVQSAHVTLMSGNLNGITEAFAISRATMKNIRQNLFFAFAYNAVGIPIAAGVLFPFFGILLSPVIAATAMSFSSVSVIANALRLNSEQH